MKVKADLHNHPGGIFKDYTDLRKLFEMGRRNLGAGGVLGFVNYGATDPYSKLLETIDRDVIDLGNAVYSVEDDFTILRGQEIPTIRSDGKMGEVVVFGLDRNLECDLDLKELLKRALGEGGVNYVPHPYLPDSIGEELEKNPDLLKYFDAWEIYNSQAGLFDGLGLFDVNRKAEMFYELEVRGNHEIGGISSTDRGGIGKSCSLIDKLDLSDADGLRSSLRQSLRKHKDYSEDRQTALRGKVLVHIGKVVLCDKVGARIPFVNGVLKKVGLVH